MKKIGLFVLTILFILPLGVKAETKPKVLKVTSTVEKTTIKYEGTTEDDVYAVMCKLYNSKNEEIDTSPILNRQFYIYSNNYHYTSRSFGRFHHGHSMGSTFGGHGFSGHGYGGGGRGGGGGGGGH